MKTWNQPLMNEYISYLYSRDNLTTTEVTSELLHEVAGSLGRDTTIKNYVSIVNLVVM